MTAAIGDALAALDRARKLVGPSMIDIAVMQACVLGRLAAADPGAVVSAVEAWAEEEDRRAREAAGKAAPERDDLQERCGRHA